MPLGYSSKITGRPVLLAFNYAPGGAIPGAFAFSRASTAFETANDGTLVSKAINAYRDSHYIGGVRTLLLESAATNLLIVSSPMGAGWLVFGGVDSGAVLGVAGTVGSARRWAGSSSTTQVYRTAPAFAAGDYSISYYVKAVAVSDLVIVSMYGTPNSNVYHSANLATVAGVWKRLTHSRNAPTAISQYPIQSKSTGATTNADYDMVQVEAGLVPSSAIVTAGVTASRSADSLVINVGGTLYLKYTDYLGATIETATPFISGGQIVAATPRAYQSIKVGLGTYSLVEMRNAT